MNARELHALYVRASEDLGINTDSYDDACDSDAWDRVAIELNRQIRSDSSDVLAFQQKFDIPMSPVPAFLDNYANTFRINFMDEELREYVDACNHQDLAKAADALVDLVYVAHGTALMMGLPWDKLWAEVQRANMDKVRATSVDQSKRKSTLDVVKPPGWQAPNHHPALENAAVPPDYFHTAERCLISGADAQPTLLDTRLMSTDDEAAKAYDAAKACVHNWTQFRDFSSMAVISRCTKCDEERA